MGFLSFLKSKPEPETPPVALPIAAAAETEPSGDSAAIVVRTEIVDAQQRL